jgi:hypothetical protein
VNNEERKKKKNTRRKVKGIKKERIQEKVI